MLSLVHRCWSGGGELGSRMAQTGSSWLTCKNGGIGTMWAARALGGQRLCLHIKPYRGQMPRAQSWPSLLYLGLLFWLCLGGSPKALLLDPSRNIFLLGLCPLALCLASPWIRMGAQVPTMWVSQMGGPQSQAQSI